MKTIACAAVVACLATSAGAQDADFYRGKTLTIACHTGPGGGYDTYARVLSRHIGRHIPGNPNVIVLNQPGAGGLLAINHAGKMAPRDGTFFALVGQGLMVHEPTGQPGLQVSLGDFNWLGNLARSTFILATWPRSKIKTLDDAKKQDVVMPSTGVGGTDSQLPAAYNALLGTRFRVVQGYDGGGQMNLSAERGETEGRGAWNWRLTRSSGHGVALSLTVVRAGLPRTTPCKSMLRIKRSTPQRGASWPSRFNCRQTLRTP